MTSVIPAGTIVAFASDNIPQGWRLCDGSTFMQTDYPDLWNALKGTCGEYVQDGKTFMNLPDLRGRFLRGVSYNSGRDPDADKRMPMNNGGSTGNAPGSVQTSQAVATPFLSTVESQSNPDGAGYGAVGVPQVGTSGWVGTGAKGSGWVGTRFTNSLTSTASETRPINAYVNFIILTANS